MSSAAIFVWRFKDNCDFMFCLAATITQAKNVLHGIIGGVSVPFPVSPSDNCGNSLQCPIQPGTTVMYTITLRCPGFAPAVSRMGVRYRPMYKGV